jgi:hypothetical protein
MLCPKHVLSLSWQVIRPSQRRTWALDGRKQQQQQQQCVCAPRRASIPDHYHRWPCSLLLLLLLLHLRQ